MAKRLLTFLLAFGTPLGFAWLIRQPPKAASSLGMTPLASHARIGEGPESVASDAGHERKMLESVLQRNPGHVPVLLRLAALARDMGRQDEATRYLREVIRREPRNVDARLELSRILFDAGDVGGALRMNSEVLDLQPRSADALYNLGAIYGNLGNYELAVRNWTEAIASDPASASGKRAREMLAVLQKESQR